MASSRTQRAAHARAQSVGLACLIHWAVNARRDIAGLQRAPQAAEDAFHFPVETDGVCVAFSGARCGRVSALRRWTHSRTPAALEYFTPGPPKLRQRILHGVSGAFSPGKLTAVMGPRYRRRTRIVACARSLIRRDSGCGKSTLLELLCQRRSDGQLGPAVCSTPGRAH
jgi:hypothetical protein